MQFLDLSQNALDKKSIEYITTALPAAPTPGLVSLRVDDCSLKPAALDALGELYVTLILRMLISRVLSACGTGIFPAEHLPST